MRKGTGQTRKSMFLIAFGVILYCLLQNIGTVAEAFRYVVFVFEPILFGLSIAFILNVYMSRLEKRCEKLRFFKAHPTVLRGTMVTVVIVVMIGLINLCMLVLIPQLGSSIRMIINVLPRAGDKLNELLSSLMIRWNIVPSTIESVQTYVSRLVSELTSILSESTGNIANYVLNTFVSALGSLARLAVGIMIAIYVLYWKEAIRSFTVRSLEHFLPERRVSQIRRIAQLSFSAFSNFVHSQLLQGIILGVLCWIGMVIFRFPYAPVISLMTGIGSLIPIFGGWVAGIISALLIAASSPVQGLFFILFMLVLQQLVGSLIYPRLVGQRLGMPSMLVLCSVVIGQAAFGIVGMLVIVPIASVIFTIWKEELKKPLPAAKPTETKEPV